MVNNISNDISIRDYSKDDKASIINLLGFLLEGFGESERKELFEWRYERNPYQNKPIIFLAFSKETWLSSRFLALKSRFFGIFESKLKFL